jgi:hypothetical protein
MYSDEWLKEGFSSGKQIRVSDFVYYRIWHDKAGATIGATVDFETANDFHYEMPGSEWKRFLNTVLRVKESEDVTAAFREYFKQKAGMFDFESDLRILVLGTKRYFSSP